MNFGFISLFYSPILHLISKRSLSLKYCKSTYFICIMVHFYPLCDFYIPYGNYNFILVLIPKFPGSLILHFTICQFINFFFWKNPSLAQFIPRIYNKIYYKNSRVFWGVTLEQIRILLTFVQVLLLIIFCKETF